jgi:tetratricopeptide (TPR) repeat protein
MAKRAPTRPNPKITPPALPRIFTRARLHKLLDHKLTRTVVWISGPPGAGKTTMVANYLDVRKIPALWYQVDSGDNDVATFFHYLSQAAKQAAPRFKTPLPVLTPEYLPSLDVFTRRFVLLLCERLPKRCTLVLDNYQTLPVESPLHNAMACLLEALPRGYHAIVISRGPPPPTLARLQANQVMDIIEGDALLATPRESRGIALLRRHLPARTIRALQETTAGWIAGIVLMAQKAATGDADDIEDSVTYTDEVFNYFAGEVFNRTPANVQKFLLKTALFETMTVPMAQALTGMRNSRRILNELVSNGYFTIRHGESIPAYQYHALFRHFLLGRAAETWPPKKLHQIKRTVAELEEASGKFDAAVKLYESIGEWQEIARLVLQQAPPLMVEGRFQTVKEWLAILPQSIVEATPWLQFWNGNVLIAASDPVSGRAQLERAYVGFTNHNDVAGQLLACSGVLTALFFEWSEFAPLDYWIAELERLAAQYPNLVSPEIEAQVIASIVAVLHRQPQHPLVSAWRDRGWSLLRVTTAPHLQIALSIYLLHIEIWRGDFQRGVVLLKEIESLSDLHTVVPMVRIVWNQVRSLLTHLLADHDAAYRATNEALLIAREFGIHLLDTYTYGYVAFTALSEGDLDKAKDALAGMEQALVPARSHDLSFISVIKAGLALRQGDFAQAKLHAMETLEIVTKVGASLNIMLTWIVLAQALIELGEHRNAHYYLTKARQFAEAIPGPYFIFMTLIAEADLFIRTGKQVHALETLRKAFAIGRSHDYMNCAPFWLPNVMARLCAIALEHGIEPDYAIKLIRKRDLVAPSPAVDDWPWLIKIYCLGNFRIVRDGSPLHYPNRTQKKVLEMLKALIMFGGQDVDEIKLTETVWPDVDGDRAHQSFKTTLHRLRKLLGTHDVILVRDGGVSLNRRSCWVDTLALGSLLKSKLENRNGSERLLALYRGTFLEKESSLSWAQSFRDQLHTKLQRRLSEVGLRWDGVSANL